MKELIGNECFNILDSKEYILFYFGATWCKPCQEILPKLLLLENELNDEIIKFFKIDIDKPENNLICEKCKIKVVPAFLIFKEREFLDRRKGNQIRKFFFCNLTFFVLRYTSPNFYTAPPLAP